MFRNARLAVIFAIALGLVASVVVWNSLQRLQAQVNQAETRTALPTVEVVGLLVAAQDITAHTAIGPDLVKVVQVPKAGVPPAAFSRVDDVNGKVVQYPVGTGQPLFPQQFIVEVVPPPANFVSRIPAGQRAMAVTVSQETDVGGLVTPGDHVDVLATFDRGTMGKDMATLILQNVVVLAVAQDFQPPKPLPGSESSTRPATTPTVLAGATPVIPTPTATPQTLVPVDAHTITLAVSPEQAQRLALAEVMGHLRLILRSPHDGQVSDIVEADLGSIRQVRAQPAAVQIIAVEIAPATLRAGDTLKVKVTVKNTSDKTIAPHDPASGYSYVQGQTYFSQGFTSVTDTIRVGLSFDDHPSAPFPYRWGLGGNLAPGATTTVTGYVKMTYDIKPTNYWVGLIQEPETILQDNEGATLVTVLPDNVAVVAVDAANVRSGPDLASSVVDQLPYGTQVPILGQVKDWFKIKLIDGRVGYVAAGWIIAPSAAAANGLPNLPIAPLTARSPTPSSHTGR